VKRRVGTYYDRHRENVLEKANKRYKENKKYRNAARKRARLRYHDDEIYREKTIRRAIKRYRKLKAQLKKEKHTIKINYYG
jgi:hypothetical protein